MLNLEKIGNKISELRKQKNLKQNELAEALFVTHQAVSKWENGKSIPSIEILYDLTKLFNVSIDYLLNDLDIQEDDYETKLRNYPREAIIKSVLNSKAINNEIEKLFYLLTKEERKTIIDLIVSKKVSIDIDIIWHIFSPDEKQYILAIILSKKMTYDLSELYDKLSTTEKKLVESHVSNGRH